MQPIPFNKPYFTGKEAAYIQQAISSGKVGGDGPFTKKCQSFFEERYGFAKCLLTTSCTDALEMAALLLDIKPGDEVIVPSFTFVSTINAFILRGATPIFIDSGIEGPNLDAQLLAAAITPRTKAIVVMHYAGVACDMDSICAIASQHGIPVVEDAAQAIDAYYHGKPLGSFGALSAFSFHETKNIISGEGGMLVINDPSLIQRAEILREKGTNRSAFLRGEIDMYNWVDVGSSFLPSDVTAAFLWAQLEQLDAIQQKRLSLWNRYYQNLENLYLKSTKLPTSPSLANGNAALFYLVCENTEIREGLINFLKEQGIAAYFHYVSLHTSQYFKQRYDTISLPRAEHYGQCLVRLPLFCELTLEQVDYICGKIGEFFNRAK